VTTGRTAPNSDQGEPWKRLGSSLPGEGAVDPDPVWRELDSFFSWYSRAAGRARVAYQSLKMVALLLAAAVTVLAASSAPAVVTACVGAAIVVVEGTQQLFKFHTNWLRYRVVTETLREHGLLYLAHLAPYDGDATAAQGQLGALLRSVIEDERKQWALQMKPPDTPPH
jgi:hypothetical protein